MGMLSMSDRIIELLVISRFDVMRLLILKIFSVLWNWLSVGLNKRCGGIEKMVFDGL